MIWRLAKDMNFDYMGQKIKNELSESFKSSLKINYKYDSNLIGGLIIKVGSVMVDTSIKTKLKKLEKNMVEA